MLTAMRVVSYYPARDPWGGMWFHWQPSVIDADMAKLAWLHANTIRVFVQPDSFGYPHPRPLYVARLGSLLSIAASHGLKVQLTLFDLWHRYSELSDSKTWAAQLLAPFRSDRRLAGIEIQNEIDPTNAAAMAWAQNMLRTVRADSRLPVTVSVTGSNTEAPLAQLIAALGPSQPDFYDLHFYGAPQNMLSTFEAAKQTAGRKPLLIGETGFSTAPEDTSLLGLQSNPAAREQAQADYYTAVERAAATAGLPPAGAWVLSDFPPLRNLSVIEQHFGLFRLDGTPKPAANVIRAAFAG